ncbi:MAG TPA: di-heme oxidoredictase family protein, partial [Verrucomicrobiae bacterium]|nr:di-heme oxidoredictase family protein [Verrucomicrobiae bacterium]
MGTWKTWIVWPAGAVIAGCLAGCTPAHAQSIDRTGAPNAEGAGIAKSLSDEIGAGRGDDFTPGSSLYILHRDPFRSIRRGRQLFQRKFTRSQGQGPAVFDGSGDIETNLAIGAGLADSCAACHGRPKGSAGHGGDVVTRPDSRDAPHLFGLGLKEMLADEITADLRSIRDLTVATARSTGRRTTTPLRSKGIPYGSLSADPDGSIDTSRVRGVDPDLRVRPFFAHGGTISIREFIAGAMKNEMGLEVVDPDLLRAAAGGRVITPSGMVLDGSRDRIDAPPTGDPGADPDGDGVANEVPESVVDHLEFYLLNYFRAGTYQQTSQTADGRRAFSRIGCASCHMPDLTIDRDRRVADVETTYDPVRGIFNSLFAIATPRIQAIDDGRGLPSLKLPAGAAFVVRDIFTDFRRHDVGPDFYERNYDGTLRREFMTTPLWGVGTTAPYGHDGRSVNLTEVILRHHGEAEGARGGFARLARDDRDALLA